MAFLLLLVEMVGTEPFLEVSDELDPIFDTRIQVTQYINTDCSVVTVAIVSITYLIHKESTHVHVLVIY